MDETEVTRERSAFVRDREESDEPRASSGRSNPSRGESRGNRRLALITLGMTAALGVGLVAGFTARSPQQVPGPTVTQIVTPSAVPTGVDTRFGMATREQYATMIFIEPGVQVVGQGAPAGTWVGVPIAADEICHWQRIRLDQAGRSVIVAEMLTNGRTVVTIQLDDNRFVSYGCRWVRQD